MEDWYGGDKEAFLLEFRKAGTEHWLSIEKAVAKIRAMERSGKRKRLSDKAALGDDTDSEGDDEGSAGSEGSDESEEENQPDNVARKSRQPSVSSTTSIPYASIDLSKPSPTGILWKLFQPSLLTDTQTTNPQTILTNPLSFLPPCHRQSFLVRKSHRRLLERLLSTTKPTQIIGDAGMGKSVLLHLIVHVLLTKACTMVLELEGLGGRVLVISQGNRWTALPNNSSALDTFLWDPTTWYIVDGTEASFSACKARLVQLSRTYVPGIGKSLFIPEWSFEELSFVAGQGSGEILDGFKAYGGNPRYVLDCPPSEDDLTVAIHLFDLASLPSLYTSHLIPSKCTHQLLLRWSVPEDDLTSATLKLASPSLADRIYAEHAEHKPASLQRFLQSHGFGIGRFADIYIQLNMIHLKKQATTSQYAGIN